MDRAFRPRAKVGTKSQELSSLVPVAIGGGVLFVLFKLFAEPPSGGKDWRGYRGTVPLQPGVVYRIEMRAPFSTTPASDMTTDKNQAAVEQQLGQGGAKNLSWSIRDDGVYLDFDQSFPDVRTLTFGRGGVGAMVPVTARRLDGLDWSAP